MRMLGKLSPIVAEVQAQYTAYRTEGKSRTDAILAIESDYADMIHDVEDNAAVMLGLALSLCKKKELTGNIQNKTINAICRFKESMVPSDKRYVILTEAEEYLNSPSLLGPEAFYRCRSPFVPDWQNGDLFSHTLTHPSAKQLGIENWTILFYKVGAYQNNRQQIQLMYVSLCPPGQIPTSSEQLQRIGFLRMMEHTDKWDYLVQISLRSAKDEEKYQLTKIGNFPDVMPPEDSTNEDPFVAMPLFGLSSKSDTCPAYEDQICRIYRNNKRKKAKGDFCFD